MATHLNNKIGLGLSGALQSAVSGMNGATKLIEVTSNNLVNASNPDYTSKRAMVTTNNADGITAQVAVGEPQRIIDQGLIEEVRHLTSQSAYYDRLGALYQSIQREWSVPGHSSLALSLQNFSQSVSALASAPAADINQKKVIWEAQSLAKVPEILGQALQALRTNCDKDIAKGVTEVNECLKEISGLNKSIMKNYGDGLSTAHLEDHRDKALRKIATFMNVDVEPQSASINFSSGGVRNKLINIFTPIGYPLLQNNAVNELEFTPVNSFDAGIKTSTPLYLSGHDISSEIIEGSIGANAYMRDVILPNLQNDLDVFTQQLRDTFNAVHNMGTGIPPANILRGQKNFLGGTGTAFSGTGTIEIKLVDLATGQFLETISYDLATATTLNDITTNLDNTGTAGYIKAELNASNQLVISSTLGTAGIALHSINDAAHETITGKNLGFSHYFGLNDFFTTNSHTVADGNPIDGLTNTLKVRADILQTPALISRQKIQPTMTSLYNSSATADQSFGWDLSKSLTDKTSFSASANFTPRNESLGNYVAEIISFNSLLAKKNQEHGKIQNEQLNQTKNISDNISGVNSQEEVMRLIMEQKLFQVSSLILKTVKELFGILTNLRS